MTDIINELRATQYDKDNFPRMKSEWACSVGLALRAADEIERLRAALTGIIAEWEERGDGPTVPLVVGVAMAGIARAALEAKDE